MNQIKKICQQLNILPTKSKGQNFLVNDKILEKIIEAADLKSNDVILEIGPGLGILTAALEQKAKKVVAVELDKKLATFLKEKFEHQKNVQIIQADILKLKPEIYNLKPGDYKLVANLPYQITGAVLRKFLSESPKPNLMVLMLQKEVVDRILEKNKKSSIISLVVNFFGQPKKIESVSKNNFWPRPKVDSAVLKIEVFPSNRFNLTQTEEGKFIQMIKTAFSHPRKLVVSNLAQLFLKEKIIIVLEKAGFSVKARAEDIKIESWYTIYKYLYEFCEII